MRILLTSVFFTLVCSCSNEGSSEVEILNEEIRIEDTIDSFDINYWTNEIYSLDRVKELESEYEKINITCMSEDLSKDSICFQIQFDDSYRFIPLATYYVFKSDSTIKEIEINN